MLCRSDSNLHSRRSSVRMGLRSLSLAAAMELSLSRPPWPLFPETSTPSLSPYPGVGRPARSAKASTISANFPEFHLAPISMTFASLVDSLVKAKRHIIRPGEDPMEYNSMAIFADEMGAFIHTTMEMIDGLSFLRPTPYQQVHQNQRPPDQKSNPTDQQQRMHSHVQPILMPEKAKDLPRG